MTTRALGVPSGVGVWQVTCAECGSRFALLVDDSEPDPPYPRFCPFCCHRTVAYKQDPQRG